MQGIRFSSENLTRRYHAVTEHYYDVEGRQRIGKLAGLKKDVFDAFVNFDSKVFEEGAIPVKYKELIAVAAAHITRCPYCIDGHTRRAKKAGAQPEEIAEAILIAAALNAGAAIAHASIAMKSLE